MLRYPRKSHHLQQLLYLKRRTTLTREDEGALYTGLQGYQGECEFALAIKDTRQKGATVLHDIFLKQQNNHFQMDTLMVQENKIYLFEIKYFHGDYVYQDNNLYHMKTKQRSKNPFYQLQRCEDLFKTFLQKHKLHYDIHSYVIFNHPTFTLYQAPIQSNMILPNQVNRFIKKLNKQITHSTKDENNLIQTLYHEHIPHNHFEPSPNYPYNDLKKGIFCSTCDGMMNRIRKHTMQCKKCMKQESIDSAVLRSIVEFNILFEEEKISTPGILEWCNKLITVKMVRRILGQYLDRNGNGKATYYTFPKPDRNRRGI